MYLFKYRNYIKVELGGFTGHTILRFVEGVLEHSLETLQKNQTSLQQTLTAVVKSKLPSIHQQNGFTCMSLLYLHSNCCSHTVICAQKK